VDDEPERPFGFRFELSPGENRVVIFGEPSRLPSSKLLGEIGPWMRHMKSLKQHTAFAVLAANLSPHAFHRAPTLQFALS